MTRRELRESVFTILFRVEFHAEDDMHEQLGLFEEEVENAEEADAAYINYKCKEIMKNLDGIDEAINAASTGWKTSRMAKVDLTIIRLAVYEIKFEENIPTKVSINEAVELAKKFGTDDSAAFVNGILAKFV